MTAAFLRCRFFCPHEGDQTTFRRFATVLLLEVRIFEQTWLTLLHRGEDSIAVAFVHQVLHE
jgi:hypothetical protein